MDKHDVAKILHDIAVLLEVEGENPFKVRAFQKAARSLEASDEDLATLVREKRLQELPGIGEKRSPKKSPRSSKLDTCPTMRSSNARYQKACLNF